MQWVTSFTVHGRFGIPRLPWSWSSAHGQLHTTCIVLTSSWMVFSPLAYSSTVICSVISINNVS
jgi:hypothetical protein